MAYDRAIAHDTRLSGAWLGRGNVLAKIRRNDEALAAFDAALKLAPDLVAAQLGRGHVFCYLRHYDDALTVYDQIIAFNSELAEAWVGRGNVYLQLGRHDEALTAYDQAVAHDLQLGEAWAGRGNVLVELKRHNEAIAAFDVALKLTPHLPAAELGRGHVFFHLKRYENALAIFDQLIAFNAEFAEAWVGRGNVYYHLGRHDEALRAYDRAISHDLQFGEAWLSRGNALTELKRHPEALAAYDQAFALKPDIKRLEGSRLHIKHNICDWRNLESDWDHVIASIRSGKFVVDPFTVLKGPSSTADQLECARIATADAFLLPVDPLWQHEEYFHTRIRVGYMSADFRNHPISQILVSMFEHHDKARFETFAFALGPDDGSEMRARLQRAFDRFIDVNEYSDMDAATLIRDLEIDILVDLTGFTKGGRPEILAYRAAPIQVNYLSLSWCQPAC